MQEKLPPIDSLKFVVNQRSTLSLTSSQRQGVPLQSRELKTFNMNYTTV